MKNKEKDELKKKIEKIDFGSTYVWLKVPPMICMVP